LFTKGESAQIIETLFELIKQSLQDGDHFLISGFGKFCVKEKHQRRGRNPQTGESDDWIYIAGPEELDYLGEKYLKHLGQQSFYELY